MPNEQPNAPTRCPVCGQDNRCTLANPATATRPCWCYSVTISPQALAQQLAAGTRNACLCPHCAQAPQTADSDAP
ncbi:cysteine-rich CWC family protein [Pseudomonas sp. N040]|uniref:cysteine-rich CWC family protein n=1 Tax=Pseudomonas sp. N040 TaxID=2785325 RepID=UPI0018A2ABF4|nr:cysteine-rich CWC family protein [Pseudomonas sp. N040]MBF7729840.1 cysteine-rich CWC family protein [Pseudomonas sp. N040]MBW7013482.1 cysteine-rich CWC family protein [Pseudomonas sp. N040]